MDERYSDSRPGLRSSWSWVHRTERLFTFSFDPPLYLLLPFPDLMLTHICLDFTGHRSTT